jgi:segregation and condensation protein B
LSRKKPSPVPSDVPEDTQSGDPFGAPAAPNDSDHGAADTSGDDPWVGPEALQADPNAGPTPEAASELTRDHLRGLLEALVFASDRPVKVAELARLASAPLRQVRELMVELQLAYVGRGIALVEVANGWIFRTHAQFAPFVRQITGERPVRLTRAQVESLAIIAYRQPITRPEIDDIRGVDSGATLKLLLERDLVRILGKKDEPGRPILYGTTSSFLEFFGLKSLNDLPPLREATELSEESQRIAEEELAGIAVASEMATSAASEVPAAHDLERADAGPAELDAASDAAIDQDGDPRR